jgi:hypothetical protein
MAVSSAGMSENGLMINFVGPEIIKAGGFSVELTITEMSSVSTEPADRYAGFGVGLSQAEAARGADISNPASFRGRADLTNGLSDFFVELDIAGNVKIWSKGHLLETIHVGKTAGTLMAAFKLGAGFQAGDPVEAHVFLDGELLDITTGHADKKSRTFTWDHNNENFIGLSVRTTGYGELDDLIVRPLPLRDALTAQHALQHGLSGSETAGDADPDGDRLDNYTEWLWGTNPAIEDARDARIRLSYNSATQQLALGHRRLKDDALLGVTYPVLSTTNLLLPMPEWEENVASVIQAVPLANSSRHQWVERSLPHSTAQSMFLAVEARDCRAELQ